MKGQVRWQSKEYYSWINRQPCVCGCKRKGIHAHHYVTRGSVQGSDAKLLPLSAEDHERLHHGGMSQADFLKSKRINPEREFRRLHEKFIEEHGLVWDQTKHPSFEDLLSANNLATRYEESQKVNRKYDWKDSPKRFRPIEERPELWQ